MERMWSWRWKYNTLKLNKRILENSYIKELKEKMAKISELEDDLEYYKEKHKLANKRVKKLKERIKDLEEWVLKRCLKN